MIIKTSVARIVDGDTINISPAYADEHSIRLLGIDAPELNYKGRSQGDHAEQAINYLKSLIQVGDEVRIETGAEARDKYGRILGHVFKNNLHLNLKLVEEGFAVTYQIYPNLEYFDQFRTALINARKQGKGIFDPNNPLQELPFEFRMRVDDRRPHKYVGDWQSKIYYLPHEYHHIDVANRVFFFKEQDAIDYGFIYKSQPIDISKFVDKKYEKKSLKEILEAPVTALQGVSENDGKLLDEAFNIKTVNDLAECKYFKWAHAIKILGG
jgi:endonuclease YncB( thermonuclease family)